MSTSDQNGNSLPTWDKPDEFEKFEEPDLKRSGGGKKRDPGSRTSKQARASGRRDSQQKRKEEVYKRLQHIFEKFPKLKSEKDRNLFIENYFSWIEKCLEESELLFNSNSDLKFEYLRSKTGAGGQNVNKVSSAVRATHKFSNISVRNDETRDQVRNKQKAIDLLKKKLSEHLSDWKLYLQVDTGRDSYNEFQLFKKEFIENSLN